MMEIAVILVVVLAASIVGTLTGFGLSTIMIPLMVLFYPLAPALLFVGIIHWFGDLWKMVLFRQGIRWKLILSFGIPGVIATIIGARLLFSVPAAILSRVLGMFLLGYVALLFTRSSFKIREGTVTAGLGGALSGFFAGIFGMGGAIRALFLSATCPRPSISPPAGLSPWPSIHRDWSFTSGKELAWNRVCSRACSCSSPPRSLAPGSPSVWWTESRSGTSAKSSRPFCWPSASSCSSGRTDDGRPGASRRVVAAYAVLLRCLSSRWPLYCTRLPRRVQPGRAGPTGVSFGRNSTWAQSDSSAAETWRRP